MRVDTSVRADAPSWMRRVIARRVIAPRVIASALPALAVLAATLLAGCRTASVGGKADADPTLKAVVGPAENAEIAALPDSPGKTLLAERCLVCHGAGLIAQQRKDAAAWGRTVTQMRTWGTTIQDEDQAALVAFLTEHFGPGAVRR